MWVRCLVPPYVYGKERYMVSENLCMGCCCCVETCPKDAIKMYAADPPEILKKGREDALASIEGQAADFDDHAIVYNEY